MHRRVFLWSLFGAALLPGPIAFARGSTTSSFVRDSMFSALSQIKWLTFDVYGTSVDFYSPIVEAGLRLNRDVDWDAIIRSWRRAYRDSLSEMASNGTFEGNVSIINLINLRKILSEQDLTFSEEDLYFLNESWNRSRPWRDVIPGLARLGQKFGLTTLANGS